MFYDILLLLSAVIGLAYYFIRQRYSYWKRLNVPYIEPKFPFGNIKQLGRKIHSSRLFQKYYNELKGSGPFGGLYFFIDPTVLATDLDFVRNVLIKDFNHFASNGMFYNEKDDPLSANLLALDGEKWRRVRSIVTPTFTSGKMKFMFPMILNVADELKSKINSLIISGNGDIEIKDIAARFTTDVIGTCAFGIECNSLKNENSDFRKYGRAVFDCPRNSLMERAFMRSFTNLARKLKMKMFADDVSEFFMGSLAETIKYREENNIKRNDFLNMMMQLMKRGKLDEDVDDEILNAAADTSVLSFNEIATQLFAFFVGGFETSATTLAFCLFELSVNLQHQRKARQEVNDVLRKHNGEFTYEALTDMHFIERCVLETLRKYPPTGFLFRICTKEYTVPNTAVTLSKNTTVIIPTHAIHHDPEIYPSPEIYDPERFLPEEVRKRHPLSFLAFGDGPKNCIGFKFGLMQIKVGLASILKKFELSSCSKSSESLVMIPNTLFLLVKGGLWINVKNIEE